MDSNDVAQYLASPSMAGSSHSSSSFIISASVDFSFRENRFKISGSLLDEKGMDSATWWGKKTAPFVVVAKFIFIFLPGCRSVSKKLPIFESSTWASSPAGWENLSKWMWIVQEAVEASTELRPSVEFASTAITKKS